MNGDIKFENISFSYPTRPDAMVLQNLSLIAREGETTALVGSSGCGENCFFFRTNMCHIQYDFMPKQEKAHAFHYCSAFMIHYLVASLLVIIQLTVLISNNFDTRSALLVKNRYISSVVFQAFVSNIALYRSFLLQVSTKIFVWVMSMQQDLR